ncbi:glycosyltransferase [Pelagibius sp. 7325]|uniref:glycosyltransferase n=1 Tax=Pelagibius sp. 7325 TaxID=3131994 RepID=UPI0030EE0FC8
MKFSGPQAKQRHLLHVFASFGYGGVPIRICDVINGLPAGFRHTVVTLDGCFDAGKRLAPHTEVAFRTLTLPRYNLLRSMALLRTLVRQETPQLMLTYNWGAIEPALANRFLETCAHIHFESGFGVEEGNGQLWRRNIFRRVALARVRKVVVPSFTLMNIAAEAWSVPAERLQQIPNGVDLVRYGAEPGRREGVEALGLDPATTIIGTVAPLRAEKNVARLLRAFAALPGRESCSLVIAGDGAERGSLERLAVELGIAGRSRFLGHVEDVPAVLRALDIFALSSDTEQMPNSLLQAMAAGRPVAAVDVGDVARIVAGDNRALVVPRDAEGALTAALAALAGDADRRRALGAANRERAAAHYSLDGMIAAYAALFAEG